MGTFHQNKSSLHGLTVAVDLKDGGLWIGRCDDEDEERVILLDADHHEASHSPDERQAWLSSALRVGQWPRHRHVVLDRSTVGRLRLLGDLED